MIQLFLALLAIAGSCLPSCYALAWFPGLIIVQRLFVEPREVVLSIGPADVSASDFALTVLLGRYLFEIARRREITVDKSVFTAIAVFLGVIFFTSAFAGVKFGQSHAIRCVISWVRLLPEMLIVPVMAQALKTLPQARRCAWMMFALLGVLVAIQFANFLGASHGFIIGEVQGIERGELRYFGPVGDSVGFVLLLGYLLALCYGRVVLALLVLASIALTSGLGSMFAAAVATGFFLIFVRQAPAFGAAVRGMVWALPAICFGVIVVVVFFSKTLLGPMLNRAENHGFENSGAQRLASATMATEMILDNPVLGVGYMGYERALDHYGGDRFFNLAKHDGGTANANNQYLQSLTDGGVPGFIAFGLLIFCVGRRLYQTARHCGDPFFSAYFLGSFLWMLTMVFGNLAAIWLVPSYISRLMWIVTGTAIGVTRLLAERAPESTAALPPHPESRLVPA